MQLGVNHLAHFALTGLLLDVITATPKARVHSTSSSAAFMGAINLDDLMGEELRALDRLRPKQTRQRRLCHGNQTGGCRRPATAPSLTRPIPALLDDQSTDHQHGGVRHAS